MFLKLSKIPEDQKTPLVELLLRLTQDQANEIAFLKDEISKLKGQKKRPKIPSSKVSKDAKHKKPKKEKSGLSSSLSQRDRKYEQRTIEPACIPSGSRFKGYDNYTVQDLHIQSVEIQFRLAVYVTPDGKRIRGELPKEFSLGHFSADLRAYCLTQYFQCHVTEPLLLEHLYDMGIEISSGELHNILIEGKEAFHQEKEEIREAGINYSDFINVDDTSSRHQGANGYCTAISSPLFSYFESTDSKSRLNFLRVLQGEKESYALTEESLNYAFEKNISDEALDLLERHEGKRFSSRAKWEEFLSKNKVFSKTDIRLATEAALVGGLFAQGFDLSSLPIMSDAAPQFALFTNALCWVHEERHYRKLIPISDKERLELETIRSQIWDFYEALKNYKRAPNEKDKISLSRRFDKIFHANYSSQRIQELMAKTCSRKEGLLLALKYPFLPLHNNDCERDIREYAKRRKISGSSRSHAGRKARDTFTSLKKTCQKLGVSFRSYISDRLTDKRKIPRLAHLIRQKALAA